ncbi:MAG: cysteine--tRNA ligase, partial [Holosporales bacterium]|nr:cysteine--tRNA ligase [Holosporales bacterium]
MGLKMHSVLSNDPSSFVPLQVRSAKLTLRLYNTLSGKIEDFVPITRRNVRMYVCGPTVYDKAHLGNARPAVVFDTLYRLLRILYPKVTYVRNITDIDDKIYRAAVERGISMEELTRGTIERYRADTLALNVLPPDVEPRATEHIADIIKFIKRLVTNGSAYVANNHVYFDVLKYKNYGALSKKNIEDLIAGARVEISENKRNPLDFVLWKPADENFDIGWESPWGKGRPGWHIECSAMAHRHLGFPFDIHCGGLDLVFPHHENEMAQSCSFGGSRSPHTMAAYWVHNGHVNIDGAKMSKSAGNFLTINDTLREYDGEVVRMSLLMSHYSSPINFSENMLLQARSILSRWYRAVRYINVIDGFDTLEA